MLQTFLLKEHLKRNCTLQGHSKGTWSIRHLFTWAFKALEELYLADSVKKTMLYKCGSRKCDSCLANKEPIARFKRVRLLNKRTELLSKCRHKIHYSEHKISTKLPLFLNEQLLHCSNIT